MRLSTRRRNAGKRLRFLLRMRKLRRNAETACWRLLRVLFLRRSEMSAEDAGAKLLLKRLF
jgi:hypothetical protein